MTADQLVEQQAHKAISYMNADDKANVHAWVAAERAKACAQVKRKDTRTILAQSLVIAAVVVAVLGTLDASVRDAQAYNYTQEHAAKYQALAVACTERVLCDCRALPEGGP